MAFAVGFCVSTGDGWCAGVTLPVPDDDGAVFSSPALAGLPAAEQAFARGLPAARAVLWVGGRVALRAALAALSVDSRAPILADERGAPVLPAGVVGSVSHKGGLAVGLVSPDVRWRLGVDLEDPRPARRDIAPRVLTAGERAQVDALPAAERAGEVLLRFSVKEAVYKALSPWLRRRIGFQEVAVHRTSDGAWQVMFNARPGEGRFEIEAWPVAAPVAPLILVGARARRA